MIKKRAILGFAGIICLIIFGYIIGKNTHVIAETTIAPNYSDLPFQLSENYYQVSTSGNQTSNDILFIDVNGDFLEDVLYVDKNNYVPAKLSINKGDNTRTEQEITWLTSSILPYTQFSDINGDGLVDIVRLDEKKILINTGNTWIQDLTWVMPESLKSINYKAIKMQDANGDGLADFLVSYYYLSDKQAKELYLNDGHGWNLTYSCKGTYMLVGEVNRWVYEGNCAK